MSFKIFIITIVIIGLNGCGSSSTKEEPTIDENSMDIPKLDDGLKVIKVPIITAKDLND